MVSPANADCVRRDRPSRKDGKMQCWLQRNRVGTTDHILRQCLLRRSCCIRPLQCLNTIHKLLNQSALRLRIQHGKEKQQGRGGGGISPALQITVCAAGNTKLLIEHVSHNRVPSSIILAFYYIIILLCSSICYEYLYSAMMT